ncbi:MAG: PIN domain-containing protein [Treponema sp.]|nr:PIN domain-containing protein [Treponema sp.]
MMYFLDTNVIIDIIDNNKSVLERFKQCYGQSLVRIPDIVFYEIKRGFDYSDKKEQLPVFLNFEKRCNIVYQTRQSLEIAARNYAVLRKSGTLIEDGDLLIGSLAIASSAILVTHNTKHLSRLQGIQLEDWTV